MARHSILERDSKASSAGLGRESRGYWLRLLHVLGRWVSAVVHLLAYRSLPGVSLASGGQDV